jgi:hypothetical protein
VLALVLAAEAAYALLGYPYPGLGAALLLGAYSVGAHMPAGRRHLRWAVFGQS